VKSYPLRGLLGVFVLLSAWGCSSLAPPQPALSGPFFHPTSPDVERLTAFTHELDGKALQCFEAANCEHVYFSRALVRLFFNRDDARASFRDVIDHNPASPLARSSALWLQVIDNDERTLASNSPEFRALTELTADFVRGWMERQFSERQNPDKPVMIPAIHVPPVEPPRVIQGLQKQLRERDRQIAVLRGQLEALKSIDQDHAEQQRKVKAPASLRMGEP
jgi:hypothetical protein